mgnify:CR=1 FL=1
MIKKKERNKWKQKKPRAVGSLLEQSNRIHLLLEQMVRLVIYGIHTLTLRLAEYLPYSVRVRYTRKMNVLLRFFVSVNVTYIR